MWYEEKANEQKLDYSKPIFAVGEDKAIKLLLPQRKETNYDVNNVLA